MNSTLLFSQCYSLDDDAEWENLLLWDKSHIILQSSNVETRLKFSSVRLLKWHVEVNQYILVTSQRWSVRGLCCLYYIHCCCMTHAPQHESLYTIDCETLVQACDAQSHCQWQAFFSLNILQLHSQWLHMLVYKVFTTFPFVHQLVLLC